MKNYLQRSHFVVVVEVQVEEAEDTLSKNSELDARWQKSKAKHLGVYCGNIIRLGVCSALFLRCASGARLLQQKKTKLFYIQNIFAKVTESHISRRTCSWYINSTLNCGTLYCSMQQS